MKSFDGKHLDLDEATQYLLKHGYVVVENLLPRDELSELRDDADRVFAQERETPFDPGDGPRRPGDDALEKYIADSYKVSDAELERVMKRIRHDRAQNLDTPWPTPPTKINKSFSHIPALFDNDKSQRVWNLPAKLKQCGRLVEDTVVLSQARSVLGDDCILSDIGANSIGPHTDGGAWHIDTPLTQMPEPLPEIPIAVQNVWMLDDFTPGQRCDASRTREPSDVKETPLGIRRYRWGDQVDWTCRINGILALTHLASLRPQFHRQPSQGHTGILLPLMGKYMV